MLYTIINDLENIEGEARDKLEKSLLRAIQTKQIYSDAIKLTSDIAKFSSYITGLTIAFFGFYAKTFLSSSSLTPEKYDFTTTLLFSVLLIGMIIKICEVDLKERFIVGFSSFENKELVQIYKTKRTNKNLESYLDRFNDVLNEAISTSNKRGGPPNTARTLKMFLAIQMISLIALFTIVTF